MTKSLKIAVALLLGIASFSYGQQGVRDRGKAMDVPEHPQEIGEAGVAWYTTWETGVAEAKRSNRPIFFMSAATTCSGVPGVF